MNKKQNKKRQLLRLFFRYTRLFVVVLAGVSTGTAIFYFIFPLLTPKEIHIPLPGNDGQKIVLHRPGPPSEKVMLVMGVDSNLDPNHPDNFSGTRTDTMLLVRVSPEKKSVSMISIPRDSKIYYGNGGGIGKINAAYAFGGAKLAVKTVEKSFGIPIDNYIVVNTQGIREVVNSIDGVEVYVAKPLKYRDRTAKLDIDLKKLSTNLIQIFLKQAVRDGFFHADRRRSL